MFPQKSPNNVLQQQRKGTKPWEWSREEQGGCHWIIHIPFETTRSTPWLCYASLESIPGKRLGDHWKKNQARATKPIPNLKDLPYEDRTKQLNLTTLEGRRQMEGGGILSRHIASWTKSTRLILIRAVASLSLPCGQYNNIPSIFPHFPVGSLIFPPIFFIFFLILPGHFGLPGGRLAHPGSPGGTHIWKWRVCVATSPKVGVFRWQTKYRKKGVFQWGQRKIGGHLVRTIKRWGLLVKKTSVWRKKRGSFRDSP